MSWPVSCLGDVSEFIRNGASIPQAKDAGGLPITRIESISERVFNQNRCGYAGVGAGEYLEYRLKIGDILVSHINSEKHLAKCAIFEDARFDVIHGMNLLCARPDQQKIFPRFFFHYLSSPKFLNLIPAITKKSVNQASFTVTAFKELPIPLPPLPEQKRIAAILDKADAIRRKRQQAIQLADDFLRAVFLDMFGDPVTNPKGWAIHKMSDVIDFKGGSQPPKETFEYEEKEGYIRLVQIRDFRTDKFKTYIPESLAKRRFEIDDVMIGRYGPPVFQILRGLSGSYNVALMKAAPKEGVTKDFVYRLLQLPAYQDAVISNSERTAGQTGVNLDLLNSLDVPLPPLDIQILMSERVGKVEELASKLKLDLHDAESLFSSLSQKAFRGEL